MKSCLATVSERQLFRQLRRALLFLVFPTVSEHLRLPFDLALCGPVSGHHSGDAPVCFDPLTPPSPPYFGLLCGQGPALLLTVLVPAYVR